MSAPPLPPPAPVPQAEPLLTWTHAIYALHALSLLTGIIGAASVVGAFLIGWPSIIAVILNYVKRGEARGTLARVPLPLADPHVLVGILVGGPLRLLVVATLGIGLLIVWLPLGVVGLWFIYRVARGWLRLVDRKPMYAES